MTDRKTAPPYRTITRIDVPRAQHTSLSNGVDLFTINAGSQELTKLEFIFRAGMHEQPATLVASATNNLLETGTRSFTANQISDGVDFYGSFLELQVDQDFATVTLYSLNRFLEESLAFVAEVIRYPTFPQDEFSLYISNKKQKHQINSQKVNVLAKREFTKMLYGSTHPYGVEVEEEDFDRITISEIRKFFEQSYHAGNCTILASGCLRPDLRDVLEKYFGSAWTATAKYAGRTFSPAAAPLSMHTFVPRQDAVQSAIRIGRVLFNKRHEDYCRFQVLNTILGGYFGSRLMANIREDKGYTYGIGSGINNLAHSGYFVISTEVGSDVTQAALGEIYGEIRKMREELVDTNELETVRNYILGHFLRSVDGPFSLAEKFRSIWEYGLDYDFFDRYFDAVKSVTPAQLRDLANKYLRQEDLMECVAGKA